MAAMVCVATMIVKIPSPMKGYINLGDCAVLLAGWLLPPGYGFIAAGLGSALADVFSGYFVYAPTTFIIKGTMALVLSLCFKALSPGLGGFPAQLIGAMIAELIMTVGYYVFEGLLYGFLPSLVNIPANAIQGVAGFVIGLALIKAFEKANIRFK